ncbi:MAG: helix-turn-helix domain-containing protein [Spirochaetaceae bacterium]|jgi:transcriptional regulator with XRE-family HTH domain|nr:helix-turn-helix domain-containing protein [Spirochaetaceae bacterium]
MNERLKTIRLKLGIKQGEFAKRINLKQGTVSDVENGKRNLTERNIKIICFEFGVNENWLKHGAGEPFIGGDIPKGDRLTINEVELIDIYQKLLPPIQKDVLKYARNMLDLQELRNTKPTNEQPDLA